MEMVLVIQILVDFCTLLCSSPGSVKRIVISLNQYDLTD